MKEFLLLGLLTTKKIAIIETLKSIKYRTGSLALKWFMSDNAEQIFLAWTAVFRKIRPKGYYIYAHGM